MLKATTSVINASQITGVLPVLNGGTGVTTSTGTGNTVLSAAPTLSGNVTLSTGNLVIGTAGQGIDFSATTSGTGTMTSELLNDYEEGTWTPGAGAGLTVVGTFSSSGTYTKIGRIVQVRGRLASSTSVAFNTNVVIATGLPFAASLVPYQTGTGMNDAWSASSLVNLYSTNVLSVGTMAATTSFDFTATYQV